MSISSTVYITKEKALEMAKKKLMYQQEMLIDATLKGMDSWELSGIINDSDLYFYNIEGVVYDEASGVDWVQFEKALKELHDADMKLSEETRQFIPESDSEEYFEDVESVEKKK